MKDHVKREENVVDALIFWWKYEKGGTCHSLATAIGVSYCTPYNWAKKNNGLVPLKHLKKINELTGGVFSPAKMRPDLSSVNVNATPI